MGVTVKLSKPIIIGCLVVALLLFISTWYKSCNLTDRYSELTGEFNAYKQVAAKNDEAAKKIIDDSNKQIATLNDAIRIRENEVFKKDEQIKEANKKLAAVESQYVDLKTDAERVVNLSNQVNIWKDKFSLAEGIIKDKDGIIFSLTEKYDAQVKITKAVETQLIDCRKLQTLYDDRISILEKELKKARFVSKLKSGAGIVLVVGAIYAILRK